MCEERMDSWGGREVGQCMEESGPELEGLKRGGMGRTARV